MKLGMTLVLLLTLVSSANAQSLSGTFLGRCSQFQDGNDQGFTTEKYDFTADTYAYQRTWFKVASCTGESFRSDRETGTIQLGPINLNHGFNPAGTREIDFLHAASSDQGVFWLSEDGLTLRLSRGFVPSSRNTLLSLFGLIKQ